MIGPLGPGGGSTSVGPTAALRVTEDKAEPWRGGLTCSSLGHSGTSMELLNNQENLANVADGQE